MSNSNDNGLYYRLNVIDFNRRSDAARRAWVTRRANIRRRDYQARAQKAWITRRANLTFGTADQSTVTERLNELY